MWWHWMGGNVTKNGIRLDLHWMKHAGVGGVQNFNGEFSGWGPEWDTPVIVHQPLTYMTPPWWQALRHSARLAKDLGLEFTIASSAGWTTTGGPWVEPKDGMKKLVWGETWVEGGKPFKGLLKSPPDTTGYFQNIPLSPADPHWRGHPAHIFYADIATIAYQAPALEQPLAALNPIVTSSAGAIQGPDLFDGDLAQTVPLRLGESTEGWIQFDFKRAEPIQALTLVIDRPVMHPLHASLPRGYLAASDDGRVFRRVLDLPQTGDESNAPEQTISFPTVRANVYRLVFEHPQEVPSNQSDTKALTYRIAELVLHTAPRVNRFEDKAGFSTRQILARDDTPNVSAESVIRRSKVIDLTQKVRSDGFLDWVPPPGRWVVLRFGYSLTGKVNDPAPTAGAGLEVDKLNREAVKRYMDAYLGKYIHALGSELMGRKGLRSVIVDSYEAGPQNWTDRMPEEFKARRGYDLLPWLPVLAGRVIESAAVSDRLLWDFRKTLGELMRDAHYEQITASVHERALTRYGESHEYARYLIGDGMEMKRSADIPMGAMWTGLPADLEHNYAADLHESASVAHLYGKSYVAAESFTTDQNAYGFAPEDLKPVADRMMAEGVNRFVIHTSVHQPDNHLGPGLGLGPFGQWFTRKETWAEQAATWMNYLAKSSYLLQQGQAVADIAYLYGEDTNVTSLFHLSAPPIPQGYSYDFVNPDALIRELSVKNGRLISRSGMEYRILALDASTQRISVPELRKIRELARAGALIVGGRPTATPSLADDEQEFEKLVNELWGGHASSDRHLVAYPSLEEGLKAEGIVPDVIFTSHAPLRFLHRKLDNGELYFIANSGTQPQHTELSFRVSGRKPELWRADAGTIEPSSYRMEKDRTQVPLELDGNDAVFVLFRAATHAKSIQIQRTTHVLLDTVKGAWQVHFPPGLGAPPIARFEQLQPWTDRPEPGIRYFSGTASYSKRLEVRPTWLKTGVRLEIDLGQVKNLAEVRVNKQLMGVLWKAPFRVDITDALKAGENALEIRVTNLWPNRLIGDKQLGTQKIAYAAYDPFKADSPLLPSGLLGPVTLWSTTRTRGDEYSKSLFK